MCKSSLCWGYSSSYEIFPFPCYHWICCLQYALYIPFNLDHKHSVNLKFNETMGWVSLQNNVLKVVAEMWMHRRLLSVSWKVKCTNQNILAELIGGKQLFQLVVEAKTSYYGHIDREGVAALYYCELLRWRWKESVDMVDKNSNGLTISRKILGKASSRKKWLKKEICGVIMWQTRQIGSLIVMTDIGIYT